MLIAPGFDDEALALLQKKKNRRLLRFHPERVPTTELDLRRVFGGVLVQEPDHALEDVAACRVATQRKPTEDELRALAFGWAVVKHVKSNAVVFASRRRHARDRRRRDLARRRDPPGAREGGARRHRSARLGARERRVLPVPRRPRGGRGRGRHGVRAARRLGARRRGDRGGGSARRGDGLHGQAPLPALSVRVLVVGVRRTRARARLEDRAEPARVASCSRRPAATRSPRSRAAVPEVRGERRRGARRARARARRSTSSWSGPEDPLVAGLADRLREAGIAVFGPSARRRAARGQQGVREGVHGAAPHPDRGVRRVRRSRRGARATCARRPAGCVVKADGLAAGKGVAVCDTPEQALAALDEAMRERRFGAAGERVVIEERLVGEEASYYAITDGEHVVALAAAQDHKRIGDGDRGENTGGMGAYAPAPVVDAAVEKKVLERIVYPAIRGLAAEGTPYRGVLFVGLMIDAAGDPRVIEFNVRFGDPETQPLVMQMASDLVPLLDGAARGALGRAAPPETHGAAVCVVLASEGYPRAFANGRRIDGLDAAARRSRRASSSTPARGAQADGSFVTAGGRVLGVTARGGERRARARARLRARASGSRSTGMQVRRDIARARRSRR